MCHLWFDVYPDHQIDNTSSHPPIVPNKKEPNCTESDFRERQTVRALPGPPPDPPSPSQAIFLASPPGLSLLSLLSTGPAGPREYQLHFASHLSHQSVCGPGVSSPRSHELPERERPGSGLLLQPPWNLIGCGCNQQGRMGRNQLR